MLLMSRSQTKNKENEVSFKIMCWSKNKKMKYFMWKFRSEYDRLNAYIHVRQIKDLPTWRIPVLNIDRTLYSLEVLITRLDNEE